MHDNDKVKVLVNSEEQYSFWPEWKEIPEGWKDTGFLGTKAEASDYVKRVWVDMRPLSLRQWMEINKQ